MKKGLVLAIILVSTLLISSISLASAESNDTEIIDMPKAGTTPDSVFYGVDVFFDNARATLTPGSLGKAKVRLDIMGERMAEMEQMANENQAEEAQRAELEMRKQMQKFEGTMEKVKKKDAMKLNEHIQTHAEILEILKERFEDFGQPDYSDAIAEAISLLEESEGIIINIPENLSPDAIFMISASCQEAGATTAEECNELLASGLLTAQPYYCTPDEPCDDLPSYPAEEYPCSGGGSYWNYRTKWCCDDSDGLYSPEYVEFVGFNWLDYYYLKGTVEYKIITLKTGEAEEGIERDSCNGDTLTEWLCPTTMSMVTRNERYSEEYVCPYGCEDGACMMEAGCSDSDWGKNYFEKGTAYGYPRTLPTDPMESFTDKCEGNILREYVIIKGCAIRSFSYTCPNGCQNGACIGEGEGEPEDEPEEIVICTASDGGCDSPSVCQNGECVYEGVAAVELIIGGLIKLECIEDSDGGKDYFVKGTVTSISNFTESPILIDTCVDDSRLAEGFCGNNNEVDIDIYSCPNGCQDGACIE